MNSKATLFKMDLRIDKKQIKLKVFEQDSMFDLIQRLAKAVTWKQVPKDKVKGRLQDQFRKIMEQQALSLKVKSKINELLEESKLVIVNVQTSNRNDPQLNETPFQILQESHNFTKKTSLRPYKKHYNYLDNITPDVTIDPKCRDSSMFDNIRITSNSQKNINLELYPRQTRKEDSCSELIQRKYAAIDKKCDDYITKHEQLHNKYKLTKNQGDNISYHHNAIRKVQYIQQNNEPARYNQQRISRERQPLIVDQNRFNRNYSKYTVQGCQQGTQSFQDYKINRYKSTKGFFNDANHDTKAVSQRDPRPSRSLNRVNCQKQNNTMVLLRQYDDNSQQNYVPRQTRKFSYNLI